MVIIAAAAVAAFVINHVRPSVTWVDLMRAMGVPPESYSRCSAMCVLGIVISACLLVVRTVGFRRLDE
jgi:hypothetical protein